MPLLPIIFGEEVAELPTKIADHAAAARDRFLEQYKGKPKLEALSNAFAARIQGIEDALWQLFTERWIDSAVGAQLDVVGKILVQPRDSLSATDEEYRAQLRAKVKVLTSSGTVENLYTVVRLLHPTASFAFTATYPAGFYLRQYGLAITSTMAQILAAFIRLTRGGGIRGTFLWQESAESDVFKMDTSGQGMDQGKFSGAVV